MSEEGVYVEKEEGSGVKPIGAGVAAVTRDLYGKRSVRIYAQKGE